MKILAFVLSSLVVTSAFAVDQYKCQAAGSFTNLDGETATVSNKNLTVTPDSDYVYFGKNQGWRITLDNETFGNENPLVLTVLAPNQNANIGQAYAEAGSKYIGFNLGSDFAVVCTKK